MNRAIADSAEHSLAAVASLQGPALPAIDMSISDIMAISVDELTGQLGSQSASSVSDIRERALIHAMSAIVWGAGIPVVPPVTHAQFVASSAMVGLGDAWMPSYGYHVCCQTEVVPWCDLFEALWRDQVWHHCAGELATYGSIAAWLAAVQERRGVLPGASSAPRLVNEAMTSAGIYYEEMFAANRRLGTPQATACDILRYDPPWHFVSYHMVGHDLAVNYRDGKTVVILGARNCVTSIAASGTCLPGYVIKVYPRHSLHKTCIAVLVHGPRGAEVLSCLNRLASSRLSAGVRGD